MNKKRILPLLLMAALLAFSVWMSMVRQKNTVPIIENTVAATNTGGAKQQPSNTWVSPVPNDRDPEYTYRSLKADEQGDHEFQGRAPISFFGRVVDQDDQPLAGVSVEFSWTDLSAKGTSQAATTSDSAGRFELLGRTGKSLSVKVTKEGYYPYRDFSWNSYEYGSPFGRHFPDKNAPVLFRLKKQGKVEPLFAWTAGLQVTNDGTVTVFQLQPAVVTERGDLRLQCKLGPENPARHFDWEFSMAIPGGGFVAIDEEFPFLAPENGYVDTVAFTATADDPGWKPGFVRREFYVRLSNPVRYGRIRVEFDPATIRYYKHSSVLLSFWINPSGSRVLEASKGEPMKIPREVIRRRDPWTGGQ